MWLVRVTVPYLSTQSTICFARNVPHRTVVTWSVAGRISVTQEPWRPCSSQTNGALRTWVWRLNTPSEYIRARIQRWMPLWWFLEINLKLKLLLFKLNNKFPKCKTNIFEIFNISTMYSADGSRTSLGIRMIMIPNLYISIFSVHHCQESQHFFKIHITMNYCCYKLFVLRPITAQWLAVELR